MSLRKFASLDEVEECAREGGERFRKHFGIEGEASQGHIDEALRLIDVIRNEDPFDNLVLVFNDKPQV